MSIKIMKMLVALILLCIYSVNTNAARENIVFILTDDQDQYMFDDDFLETYMPTLYQLKRKGLTFTNYVFATPLCGPSRASILTGRYAHNTGIKSNTPESDNGVPGGFGLFFEKGYTEDDIGAQMRAAGYYSIFVGKYHNNGFPNEGTGDIAYAPPGWDALHASLGNKYIDPVIVRRDPGQASATRFIGSGYRTDIETDATVEFLESVPATQPFFLYSAPFNVHLTTKSHDIYAPRHAGFASNETWPVTPDVNEADISDKASNIQAKSPLTASQLDLTNHEHRDRIRSALAVEDMLATIVNHLQSTGQITNTIFFFSTDNGYHMGNHRLYAKRSPYDLVTRVPLIVSGKGVAKGTRDHLLSNIDLFPTFLHIAGKLAQESVDGRSFRSLLVPAPVYAPEHWREALLIEHWEPQNIFGEIIQLTYTGLRFNNEAFIQYKNGNSHEEEYYDLSHDPYQLENIISLLPATRIDALRETLQEMTACSGKSCNKGIEIKQIAPHEGDIFSPGTNINVAWQTTLFPPNATVRIALHSIRQIPKYHSLIATSAENSGNYTFQLPTGLIAGVYRVRLMMSQDDSIYDAGAIFTVNTSTLGVDITGDGFVDSEDLSILRKKLPAGDANNDGIVDWLDLCFVTGCP